MQRLRIKFRRGQELKFISHLDIIRLWQRALNRAGISLAYSEGFNPHPRMSLAAPLAVGVTSEAELMDIVLAKWVSPHSFASALSQQLPVGIQVLQVFQIALTMPSLQSQVRYAEYEIQLATEKGQKDIESAITSLLSVEHLSWQHQRDKEVRRYDLRALVDDIWMIEHPIDRIPCPVNHVDHTLWKPTLIDHLKDPGLGHRHLLRGFHNISVPTHHCIR